MVLISKRGFGEVEARAIKKDDVPELDYIGLAVNSILMTSSKQQQTSSHFFFADT